MMYYQNLYGVLEKILRNYFDAQNKNLYFVPIKLIRESISFRYDVQNMNL